jgi:hypothetical protein
MLFRFSAACLVLTACAAGCSAAASDISTGHLDSQSDTPASESSNLPTDTTEASPATATSTTTATADACTAEASWKASPDLSFDDDGMAQFARAMNGLIHASDESAIAITSHLEPHCVWKAVFSADDQVSHLTDTVHAASATQILRQDEGLWTASPQSVGWMQVVDAVSHRIWIPLADITASAKYESADCSKLSARASVTIAAAASSIALTTSQGPTTLGALLGKKTSSSGWKAHMTFSAESSR